MINPLNYFNPFYKEKLESFTDKVKRLVLHQPKNSKGLFANIECSYNEIASKVNLVVSRMPLADSLIIAEGFKFSCGMLFYRIFFSSLSVPHRLFSNFYTEFKVEKLCKEKSLFYFIEEIVVAPLYEELLSRAGSHEAVSRGILSLITRNKSSNKASKRDKIVARIAGVFTSSMIFTLSDTSAILIFGKFDNKVAFNKVMLAFFKGLFSGVIYESRLGFSGSMGFSFFNNALFISRLCNEYNIDNSN